MLGNFNPDDDILWNFNPDDGEGISQMSLYAIKNVHMGFDIHGN